MALLAGVSRLTITLAVIMLELTSSLQYLIPIMVCLLFSKMTGDFLSGPESIYERQMSELKSVNHIKQRHARKLVDCSRTMCSVPVLT